MPLVNTKTCEIIQGDIQDFEFVPSYFKARLKCESVKLIKGRYTFRKMVISESLANEIFAITEEDSTLRSLEDAVRKLLQHYRIHKGKWIDVILK